MSKLVILNTYDRNLLDKALNLGAELVLIQDAVYFANNRVEANLDLASNVVYGLEPDVMKRGLKDRLIANIKLLDTGSFVDLLFSGKTVINL
jgi:sulfur relay protein TusB/DsrH